MKSPAPYVVGSTQHVLGMHLFGFIVEDDKTLTPGLMERIVSEENRSVVDILADIGKTPKEIRQLMRETAEDMARWCLRTHVRPVDARHRIHAAAMSVLKGRRFSGASPKRSADKMVSRIMCDYERDYGNWLARVRRERARQERDGEAYVPWQQRHAKQRADELKKRWKGRRRGKR